MLNFLGQEHIFLPFFAFKKIDLQMYLCCDIWIILPKGLLRTIDKHLLFLFPVELIQGQQGHDQSSVNKVGVKAMIFHFPIKQLSVNTCVFTLLISRSHYKPRSLRNITLCITTTNNYRYLSVCVNVRINFRIISICL